MSAQRMRSTQPLRSPTWGTHPSASSFRSAMFRRSLYFAASFLFGLAGAQAQSNYAVVRGSVLDPHHRPVAGAQVHITSTDTGAQREVGDTANAGTVVGENPIRANLTGQNTFGAGTIERSMSPIPPRLNQKGLFHIFDADHFARLA